jgi:hypothetical protein
MKEKENASIRYTLCVFITYLQFTSSEVENKINPITEFPSLKFKGDHFHFPKKI